MRNRPLRCRFDIVESTPQSLMIRDCCDECCTVTNDAEAVVDWLLKYNFLQAGRRLLYFDTAGELDEILFDSSGFTGFTVLSASA